MDKGLLDSLPAFRRVEAEKRLRRLAELQEARKALQSENPLQFVRLYPKQVAFVQSAERTKAFFGGNGAGKTHVGVIDDLIQLVDRDVLPAHLQELKRWEPPFHMRVVVPKMKIIDTLLLEKFRMLCPRSQLLGDSFDKAYDKVNMKLRFKNGSHVLFNTSDQDRDAHAGVELHRVHFDEEPEGEHGRGIYVENTMRLRKYVPHAQIMFTMTPLFGMDWVYDEIWERRDEPNIFCVSASLLDNEFIDAASMAAMVEHLPARELQAIIEGKFVNFHGHVLENFMPDGEEGSHVVSPPSRSHVQGIETLVGIDPGVARGGVVWVGFDRDNSALVYDELYPSGMTIPQIAEAIREKNKAWGVEPSAYVIDPSARNRSLTDAEAVTSLFMQEGIYPMPGQNDRQAGILQLRARIESRALLISRDCQNWLHEVNRYVVAEDEESGKGAAAGFRTKGPDHLIDPTRYCAMERLWTSPADDAAGPRRRSQYGFANPEIDFLAEEPEHGPLGAFT